MAKKNESDELKRTRRAFESQGYENKKAKLQRKQIKQKQFLEDQQAHGSIADTVEDMGIQLGQKLGLSQDTTTDYAMGAQDAKINLLSSNKDIVEYYKNYDANRAKKEQQVNAVYSRELSQEQVNKSNKMDAKEQERLLNNAEDDYENRKKAEKDAERDAKKKAKEAQREARYYDKAKSVLNAPDDVTGTIADLFTLD